MNRRTFIKSSTSVTLGGLALIGTACGEGREEASPVATTSTRAGATQATRALDRIGVQLYSVRSLMQENVPETLEKVAAIGYDEVEFAGYFDHSPSEIKALLDQLGLEAPAAHIGYGLFENDLDGLLEAAQIIGHQYLICPWLAPDQRSIDDYKRHAAFFNRIGEACKGADVQFAYHNHDFEYEVTDGQIPYDVLLAETDPDLVMMELDLYWITKAEHDALAYFKNHPGRFPLCHVKDMSAGGEITTVGKGQISFGTIFAQSEQAGLAHYIVEHDNAEDPMASIESGYQHLQQLRY